MTNQPADATRLTTNKRRRLVGTGIPWLGRGKACPSYALGALLFKPGGGPRRTFQRFRRGPGSNPSAAVSAAGFLRAYNSKGAGPRISVEKVISFAPGSRHARGGRPIFSTHRDRK